MTKAEYIKRYGEEAYKKQLERVKAYYSRNKEKVTEYQRAYREANKEKVAECKKAYYEANKEMLSEQKKMYREANREKIAERNKAYREANREKIAEYNKNYEEVNKYKRQAYRKTKNGRAIILLSGYKQNDKKFNRGECTLTVEWIVENIFSGQVCHWCSESNWKKLGCDRINNDLPHTPDNVVCSCVDCNKNRGKMTYDEYRQLLNTKIA